jgi:clan AA aspartic protease (TIGR02281 family)
LDDGGNAVALSLGGNLALPVDAAIAWLGQRQRSDLDELQQELRMGHPDLVIEDATALLTQRRTLAEVRDALALLDRAAALVQDRQALLRLEELRKTAAQILVQDLARVDGASALAEARQQLSRHPGHPGLLADTLVLALNNGDALEALGLYDQLFAMSPDHAREVAEDLTRGLVRLIRRRLTARRYQEAINLAAGTVGRFAQRADLRMLYANALWQSGRQADAVEQGGIASQLDPAHRERVSSWQASLARARDPDTVVLPYDPATNAIFTQVTIGGQVLEVIIDTGASLTTIPAEFAERLGLVKPDSEVIRVNTANGEIRGRRVRLPNLTVGSIRMRGVDAVVINIPGLEGRGLLGLNVLQLLNMQIDSENKVLILRRRRRQP